MESEYIHFYQTLGLEPGADWHTVRQSYRSLVRKWHPDRFTGDVDLRTRAEERTKEITAAYQSLESYYRVHGATPASSRTTAADPAPTIQPTAQPTSAPYTEERPTRRAVPDVAETPAPDPRRKTFTYLLAVAVLVVIAQFALNDDDEKTTPEQAPGTPNTPGITPGIERHETIDVSGSAFFTLGSTPSQVHAVQGNPSRIENDVWHYGHSKVYFHHGAVWKWEVHPDFPLRARYAPVAPAATTNKSFSIGATKADVRAAQGEPTRETDAAWDFGSSRVYFRGDRVVSVDESPFSPLRFTR